MRDVARAAGGEGGGVGKARLLRRELRLSKDAEVWGLEARCKAAASAALKQGMGEKEVERGEGTGAEAVEASSELRFVFKVVKSLSLVLLLAHDGREAMCFDSILALHCPEPSPGALSGGDAGLDVEAATLKSVAVVSGSLAALEGCRCLMHLVEHHLVLVPEVTRLRRLPPCDRRLASTAVFALAFAACVLPPLPTAVPFCAPFCARAPCHLCLDVSRVRAATGRGGVDGREPDARHQPGVLHLRLVFLVAYHPRAGPFSVFECHCEGALLCATQYKACLPPPSLLLPPSSLLPLLDALGQTCRAPRSIAAMMP